MNIFNLGGVGSTIAVIFALLIGTGIFIGINTIFECWYFGWKALIGEWFGCVIVAAFIVNFLSGIVGGIFSVLWVLIKLAVVIGILGSIAIFIYSKIKGKND